MQTEQWLTLVNKHMQIYYTTIHNIRNTKPTTSNTNININNHSFPKIEFNHTIQVIIYFFKKGVRFPVEVWSFSPYKNNDPTKHAINSTRLNKKLFILNRSIYSLLKLLPLYQLIKKSGFGFHFETEFVDVYTLTMNAIDDSSNDYKKRIRSDETGKVVLNVNSESCAGLKMEVQYLVTNSTVFAIEDMVKQEMLKEKVELQRKRVIAQSNVLNQHEHDNNESEYEIDSSTKSDYDDNENIDENEFNMSRLNDMSFTVKLGKRNESEERGVIIGNEDVGKDNMEVNVHEKQEMQSMVNKVNNMNEMFYFKCKHNCDNYNDNDDECLLDNGLYDDNECNKTGNMVLDLGDAKNDGVVDNNEIKYNVNEYNHMSSLLSPFAVVFARYQGIKRLSQSCSLNGALNLIKLSNYIKK